MTSDVDVVVESEGRVGSVEREDCVVISVELYVEVEGKFVLVSVVITVVSVGGSVDVDAGVFDAVVESEGLSVEREVCDVISVELCVGSDAEVVEISLDEVN